MCAFNLSVNFLFLPAILPGLGTYTGRMTRALFEEQNVPLPPTMTTNYLETIKMMVSIGLGWSLLPESMLEPGIRAIEIPGIHIQRELGYIHHREKSLSNAAKAFIDLLQQERLLINIPSQQPKTF